MIKGILKRAAIELFIAVLLFSMAAVFITPNAAFAAVNGKWDNGNIGLTADNNGTWTVLNGNKIVGEVTGTAASSGCGSSTSASSKESTLTIKNLCGTKAILFLDFDVTTNGGVVEIDGKKVENTGNERIELDAEASVKIHITSAVGAKTTAITLNRVDISTNFNPAITFAKPEHGTYTVDNVEVKEDFNGEMQDGATYYTLKAGVCDAGYSFWGWYLDDELLSNKTEYRFMPAKDGRVSAKFITDSTPVLSVGEEIFFDWQEAIDAAENGADKVIVPLQDSVMEGDYTIPDGVTLLIPFDEVKTCYTTDPESATGFVSPKEYRKIIINGTLNVANGGRISISAKHSSSQNYVGSVTGTYGHIILSKTGMINLQNGAELYTYGYITGDGIVNAMAGSSVYEYFQIMDWRGGTATSKMYGKEEKVFPFSQYYIQNIEATLRINKGAEEKGFTTISTKFGDYSAEVPFFGEEGVFRLKDDNGYIEKKYDKTKDRIKFDINGNAEINYIALSIVGNKVSSADYVLPINGNMTINLQDGNLCINKDISLLPGVEMSIADGSYLEVATDASLFIYDKDEWMTGKYAYTGYIKPAYTVADSPRVYKRTENDLTDVKLDINGTLIVNGNLYTTDGGAEITSSQGTGQVTVLKIIDGDKKLHGATQNGSEVSFPEIPITSAKLHNADGSYTQTTDAQAGYIYTYHNGKWSVSSPIASVDAKDYEKETAYEGDKAVELRVQGVENTEIRYTMDGTEPTEESSLYEKAIELKAENEDVSYTIKAVAYKDGKQVGPAVEFKYTITSNHKYEAETAKQLVKPTKDTEGTLERICDICGEKETIVLPALSENNVEETKAPTCTDSGEGVYTYTTADGEVISFGVVLEERHTYSKWNIDKRPTQTEQGHMTRSCTVCDNDFQEKTLPILNNIDYTLQQKVATCTEDGFDSYTLKEDESIVIEETIPRLNHAGYSMAEAKNATCEEAGNIAYIHCNRCGKNFTEEWQELSEEQRVLSALGHDYGNWEVAFDPTETETGLLTRTCARENNGEVCEHAETKVIPVLNSKDYKIEETKPTCTEAGTAVYTCTIDMQAFFFEVELKATGHDYGILMEGKAASCEKAGIAEHYKCIACKGIFDADKNPLETTEIQPLGHDYKDVTAKEENCEDEGVVAHKHCERCGKNIDSDGNVLGTITIEKKQHEYGSWSCTVEPTADKEGILARTCELCKKAQDTQTLPALIIDSEFYQVDLETNAPTCTEAGEAIYTYTINGDAFEFSASVEAIGHSAGAWIEEIPAKCGVPGVKGHYTCEKCNENLDKDEHSINDLVIPSLEHTYKAVAAKPETCEEDGNVAYKHCTLCDKNFDVDGNVLDTVTIPATGHVYGTWSVTTEPTEEAEGLLTRICKSCSTKVETKVLPVLSSENYKIEGTKPTCTEAGTAVYTCTTDDQVFSFEVGLKATGHDYGTLIEGKAATCEENGIVTHYTCDDCGMHFDESYNRLYNLVIVKTGHKVVIDEAVDATCAATGMTVGSHCDVCGTVFEEQKVIPKTEEHNPIEMAAIEATCAEAGKTAGSKCSVCDKILSEPKEIPATGEHVYKDRKCETCGKTEPSAPVTPADPPVNPPVGPTEPTTPVDPNPPVEIEDPDTPLDPGSEVVKGMVSSVKLTARSKRTSKNNVKVTVKADKVTAEVIKELREMGYAVKYRFYRSTKKASGYKIKLTKSGNTYTNTTGKKGKMYYYKAQLRIYDKDGKLVAKTALKQCEYANRIWKKK